jgi:hypothetical protein
MGCSFLYTNRLERLINAQEFGKLSGKVGDLGVRLNKWSEDQESIKCLLKVMLEQSELFAESLGEAWGYGGLIEQTTVIVRCLNIISIKSGDLNEGLNETQRKLSLVRNTLYVCVEDQKLINGVFKSIDRDPTD